MKFLFAVIIDAPNIIDNSRIDTFTFSSNGKATNGKTFLPDSFEENQNPPAIFLIDYTVQHFEIAKDEFEKVIENDDFSKNKRNTYPVAFTAGLKFVFEE